ncbi:MAG: hypothetical protein QOJ54_413 [Aliidongia sp.]|nr:hypothetical protein [Aliidongia sp.]
MRRALSPSRTVFYRRTRVSSRAPAQGCTYSTGAARRNRAAIAAAVGPLGAPDSRAGRGNRHRFGTLAQRRTVAAADRARHRRFGALFGLCRGRRTKPAPAQITGHSPGSPARQRHPGTDPAGTDPAATGPARTGRPVADRRAPRFARTAAAILHLTSVEPEPIAPATAGLRPATAACSGRHQSAGPPASRDTAAAGDARRTHGFTDIDTVRRRAADRRAGSAAARHTDHPPARSLNPGRAAFPS